jgi:hypothetical protein
MDMQNINMGQVGTIMEGIGTVATAVNQRSSGASEQTAANFQADQLDQLAGQERAASQRSAAEQLRKSRIMQSRALAVAAASGAGALDSNVLNVISGIAGEGDLASRTELYSGNDRASKLELSADTKRFEGAQRKRAGEIRAINTIATGGLSMASKYAKRTTTTTAAPASGWTSGYDLID